MSSEDDYYADRYDYPYDRRSSNRPRRRAYSPRRRTHHESLYFRRKNRRIQLFYNQYGPRLAGLIILLSLIAYEIIILKGAASADNTTLNESTTIPTSHIARRPHHNHASSAQPSSLRNVSSQLKSNSDTLTSEQTEFRGPALKKITEVAGVGADSESGSSSENVIPSNKANDPKHSASIPKTRHLPESAIRMEAKGADEDPDVESNSTMKGRKSSPENDYSSVSSFTDHSRGARRSEPGDRGAEPGAGENFWNWFQETKGSDKKSVSKSIPCPEENKRLCQMFYKYVRKYKIRRIFDVSCEKNIDWIASILKKAGNELWGFKYYCSLWDGERAEDARRRLGGLPFVQFDNAKWWRAGFAPDTELVFAWDTLAHLAYGRVWNFFVKARKQDIKYVLVDNYPGILNDPSPKRNYLNLRKHPFRFPSAKEVAQNVTEPGETAKRQLLFYETSMLPDNLQ